MKELPLPSVVSTSSTAHEVLRAWIVEGGLNVALDVSFEGPDPWGVLLVDIARHVARSYAETGRYSEEQALAAIYGMFEQEWTAPTDLGTTTDLRSN